MFVHYYPRLVSLSLFLLSSEVTGVTLTTIQIRGMKGVEDSSWGQKKRCQLATHIDLGREYYNKGFLSFSNTLLGPFRWARQ